VRHGGGVAALLTLHDLAADPLAPDGELLDGRCTESVAGGHQHFFALVLQFFRQFGDRRCFPRAVDPGDHDDGRPIGIVADPRVALGHQFTQLLLDELLDVAGDFLVQKCLPDSFHDLGCGGRPHVSQVKALLQFGEEFPVHAPAEAEQGGHAAEQVPGT
jgi:hypothetical protein